MPWDEEEHGGCLAAGRGFIHINARGDVEPCPFAPFSDANLRDMPLERALRSPFLATMRAHRSLFTETEGGCAASWPTAGRPAHAAPDITAHNKPKPINDLRIKFMVEECSLAASRA